MGWGFRRSINFGPFRMNFSKSGIGYSVGVPGARIGKDAKGRKYSQLSIPHTGVYRRDYHNGSVPPASVALQTNSISLPTGSGAARYLGRSVPRSRWVIYGGGGVLLYTLIRTIF
jgi:hypothetical protein